MCVQLVKRVYKGIPLQLRGQAWALLLDIEKVKQDNKGKYEVRRQEMMSFLLCVKLVLGFYSLSLCLFLYFPENEATGSYFLNRDQTDRLRCQQNLQEPHHVQGAIRSKVSPNICLMEGLCHFWLFLKTDLWVTPSQDSTDVNIVGHIHLWSLWGFYCLGRS